MKTRTKSNWIFGLSTSFLDVLLLKLADYAQLMKMRLLMLVVFSSVLTYAIVAGSQFSWEICFLLALGGVLVAGGANTINEILEKDYDALMSRTMNRPLPAGRMTLIEASIFAGVVSILGMVVLLFINPLTALLGAFSLLIYAFIYTPLKRISSFSVFVGAIPGALPIIIGGVAHQGFDWNLILLLFSIQFFWQFPHFWAIAWKADEQYKTAGFRLLPSKTGEKDKSVGKLSFIYSIVLFIVAILLFAFYDIHVFSLVTMLALCSFYSWKAFLFWREGTDGSALKLMYASFMYLPLVLIVLFLDFTNVI